MDVSPTGIITAGNSVTITMVITNPHNSLALSNVFIENGYAAGFGNCTPSLVTPVTLDPNSSRQYICTDVTVVTDLQNIATAHAQFLITNTAFASAPEVESGETSIGTATALLPLTDQATLSIDVVGGYVVWLPVIAR